MTRPARPYPLLLLAALGVVLVHAATASAASGPAVAVEDTMRTELSPVLVAAPRVTLDEILDRVARGEARRDSLLHDQSFLASARVVGHTGEHDTPRLLEEIVTQVWKRRPAQVASVELKHWYLHPPKASQADADVNVEFSPNMGEDIVNFAFQPAGRREYTYRIVGRELRGDHLVYRIAFRARSPLALNLPGGEVWVDTRDYVIVRQEITFEQSPVPLFVRGIRRMVIERQKQDEFWVLSRVLVRVETTIPIPRYGRSFDFALLFSRYTLNTGLPDSLFVKPGRGANAGGAR